MAKYSIDYACGHGSFTEKLFGKHTERDLEWLGSNKVCPECYKTKMQAQRQAEQITAELIYNAFSDGKWLAITKGDTYSIKDALKAAGCRWKEYIPQGDILGMSRPKKAWMLKLADGDQAVADQVSALQAAGVQQFHIDSSPLASISIGVAEHLAKRSNHA